MPSASPSELGLGGVKRASEVVYAESALAELPHDAHGKEHALQDRADEEGDPTCNTKISKPNHARKRKKRGALVQSVPGRSATLITIISRRASG